MKVLFVHHAHTNGGAAISLKSLLVGLKKQGVESDLINSTGKSKDRKFFSDTVRFVFNCRIWPFPHSSFWWYSLFKPKTLLILFKWIILYPVGCYSLTKCILKHKYNFVHFNSATLIPYGWIPKFLGVKLVCHIREPFSAGSFGLRRTLLRASLRIFTDKCIAICQDNAEDTGLSNQHCVVIYNPVNFEKFNTYSISKSSARQLLMVSDTAYVTLFAGGSNAKAKGVEDYLNVMADLSEVIEEMVCLMPSFNSQNLKDPESISCFKRIEEKIISCPFVSDIERWLAASDVVYALHINPHFSRTVMEAGAMKRPVVATDIAGIAEVVSHEVTGLLCKVGDRHDISGATLRLYRDRDLAQALGEGGYIQANSCFRSEVHTEKVLKVYYQLESSCFDNE